MDASCAGNSSFAWQSLAELAMLIVSSRHAPEDGQISDHLALAPSWQAQLQEVALKEDIVRLELSVSPAPSATVPYITCQLHSQMLDSRQTNSAMRPNVSGAWMSSLLNCSPSATPPSSSSCKSRSPQWEPVLLERWTLCVKEKCSVQDERPVANALLVQAVRSFLMFSQLQSWLSLTEYRWPVHIHYHVLSAAFDHPQQILDFDEDASVSNTFPLGETYSNLVLSLSVTARQRSQKIPFLTPELAAKVEARRQQLLSQTSTSVREARASCSRKSKRRRPCEGKNAAKALGKLKEAGSFECRWKASADWESQCDDAVESAKEGESPFRKRVTSPAIDVPSARSSSVGSQEIIFGKFFFPPGPVPSHNSHSSDSHPTGASTAFTKSSVSRSLRFTNSVGLQVFLPPGHVPSHNSHSSDSLPAGASTTFTKSSVARSLRFSDSTGFATFTATPMCSPTDDELRPRKDFRRCLSCPCSSLPPLLGSYEESILNGRLTPLDTLPGFSMKFSSTFPDGRCTPHTTLPVRTQFFESHSGAPSPYLGITTPPDNHFLPKKGTVQLLLFRPSGSIVHAFVINYDLSDLKDNDKSFIRQRVVLERCSTAQDRPRKLTSTLQYAVHLSVRPHSNRLQLYKDIRTVFPAHTPDIYNVGFSKSALVTQTVGPHIPMRTHRTSVKQAVLPTLEGFLPSASSGSHVIAQ